MKTFVPLMIAVLAFMVLASASAQEGEVCSISDKMTICGYSQLRFEGGDSTTEDFSARRTFLTIAAGVNDRTGFVLSLAHFDSMPTGQNDDIIVYNLFCDYKINDEWSARFGQVPTYFGLEGWESSNDRLALERAMITQGSGAGNNMSGFYFNGASDRGLWLKRAGNGNTPDIYLGACNGQFRNGDSDAAGGLNYSVDLKWDQSWGICGLSWFDGEYDNGVISSDRSAIDAYVRANLEGFQVQGEWADGEMLGGDRDGWYIQVSQPRDDRNWTPFVKYEEFNADATVLQTSMDYDALHGGVAIQMDDNNELTLQLTDADINSSDDFSYAASWQVSF